MLKPVVYDASSVNQTISALLPGMFEIFAATEKVGCLQVIPTKQQILDWSKLKRYADDNLNAL